MPTSGSCLPLAKSILQSARVRGRVSNLLVGITCAQALSLFVNPMPPRTTEKSYRPRVSDKTMVDTRTSHPFRLLRFRNRIESAPLLSLFVDHRRTVLPVKGSLRRALRRALDGSGPF